MIVSLLARLMFEFNSIKCGPVALVFGGFESDVTKVTLENQARFVEEGYDEFLLVSGFVCRGEQTSVHPRSQVATVAGRFYGHRAVVQPLELKQTLGRSATSMSDNTVRSTLLIKYVKDAFVG